ncbi:MAG TPA: hypothetical protein VNI77_05915 [Nitrososphaera sp.]|nr:hypothetical protein [Nitrososphaera sp.]
MTKGLRACPVCPSCGSKKFRVVENDRNAVVVECRSCSRRLSI